MSKIEFKKQIVDRDSYSRVIDTEFRELVSNQQNVVVTQRGLPTVEELLYYYEVLFYQIPRDNSNISHQYILQRTGEYLNEEFVNTQNEDLLNEVESLRTENQQLREQIINLEINSLNGSIE